MDLARTGAMIIVVLSFWAGPIRADEQAPPDLPDLVTDRPTASASGAVVSDGYLQVEFGAEFANDDQGRELSLPLVLMRYGMADGLEVRFGIPSLSIQWPEGEPDTTDLVPIELGVKYVYPLGEAASIGLLPFLTVQLMGEQYDSIGVGLGARLVWSVEVTDWMSVGGNFGILFTGLGASPSVGDREYLASLAFGFAASDALGLFLEAFCPIVESDAANAPATLDAGLTWLVLPGLQLDVYLGMNLRRAPGGVFAGMGGAYLW